MRSPPRLSAVRRLDVPARGILSCLLVVFLAPVGLASSCAGPSTGGDGADGRRAEAEPAAAHALPAIGGASRPALGGRSDTTESAPADLEPADAAPVLLGAGDPATDDGRTGAGIDEPEAAERHAGGGGTLMSLSDVPDRAADDRGPASSPAAAAIEALRVEQVVRGDPDPRPGRAPPEELQTLTVSRDGTKIILEKSSPRPQGAPAGRDAVPELQERYILRLDLDPPLLWRESPDGAWYEEHEGDLTKIQRDREVREREIIKHSRRLSRSERERVLSENHLSPDGREIEVRWEGEKEILGHGCKRLVVTENGRTIIDAWVSEEAAGGRGFFDLYRRLGAFSKEVLEKIRDVRALPLEGTITVVTKLTAHPIRFEVRKVDRVEVAGAAFDRPRGEKREPAEDRVTCEVCKDPGEPVRMEKVRIGGRWAYFCSSEHKRQYVEERLSGGRPRR